MENCEEIGSQGAIKLMLDLLNTECLDDASKLQLVVTLGHAVESCGELTLPMVFLTDFLIDMTKNNDL